LAKAHWIWAQALATVSWLELAEAEGDALALVDDDPLEPHAARETVVSAMADTPRIFFIREV
jgi:hypothetical protein